MKATKVDHHHRRHQKNPRARKISTQRGSATQTGKFAENLSYFLTITMQQIFSYGTLFPVNLGLTLETACTYGLNLFALLVSLSYLIHSAHQPMVAIYRMGWKTDSIR